MSRVPPAFVALTSLASALLALLLVELALRVAFPCDLVSWSESPFMTDMMKVANGNRVFLNLLDVNSFVYSPGLVYLTSALLGPFGLATDVRFPRVVTIAIGLGAAAVGGASVRSLAEKVGGSGARTLKTLSSKCLLLPRQDRGQRGRGRPGRQTSAPRTRDDAPHPGRAHGRSSRFESTVLELMTARREDVLAAMRARLRSFAHDRIYVIHPSLMLSAGERSILETEYTHVGSLPGVPFQSGVGMGLRPESDTWMLYMPEVLVYEPKVVMPSGVPRDGGA